MSQKAKLLRYLETHDGVTQLESFNTLGICRLSERVRELERLGYFIGHTPEHTENGARVIRYKLLNAALVGEFTNRKPVANGEGPAGAASYKEFTR